MALSNSDFQRLLTTNDTQLVNELTKRKKTSGSEGGKGKGKSRGKDEAAKARIAKAEMYKQRAADKATKQAEKDKYIDRAQMRRDMKGEYETVAAEFENHGEVSVEQSKYLGGDLDHTHLVKGLDFALLNKVRTEITKQQKVEEFQKARQERKLAGGQKKKTFDNQIARNIWMAIVETLHPHHSTFKERVHKMGKAIAQGQKIRGAPTTFLPGRMLYEFDTDMDMGRSDIPRMVYMSKEDAPAPDASRKPSGMLPDTALKVRNAMQKAAEERKQRKLQKSLGAEASYTTAQKIVPKPKAKDEDDIFGGAGVFDVGEIVKKARAEQAAKKAGSKVEADAPLAGKSSYFDDAGAEKYKKAPEGQLDLEDVAIEEQNIEAGEFHKPTGAFKPSSRFKGARKNWVFKMGDQGLGYYEEIPPKSKLSSEDDSKRDPRKPREKVKSKKVGMGDMAVDGYDELFPEAMQGGAMMTTGSDDSDEEDGKKKKGITIGKKGKGEDDPLSANKKQSDAKKRKMEGNKEWQKIDTMIKKGKVSSMESLEGQASKKRGKTSHLATPAFF
eukprot:TRINITY_DN53386_c0_g1_i1.p1 TRINITY_DN53386_c0_g1~~TRINITY_DN53386_c0_g1_i1.p1  ORF type:complete len:556 (+),score=171.06 TRINITY_DN53386_c0_g1_i1:48-1715(+)